MVKRIITKKMKFLIFSLIIICTVFFLGMTAHAESSGYIPIDIPDEVYTGDGIVNLNEYNKLKDYKDNKLSDQLPYAFYSIPGEDYALPMDGRVTVGDVPFILDADGDKNYVTISRDTVSIDIPEDYQDDYKKLSFLATGLSEEKTGLVVKMYLKNKESNKEITNITVVYPWTDVSHASAYKCGIISTQDGVISGDETHALHLAEVEISETCRDYKLYKIELHTGSEETESAALFSLTAQKRNASGFGVYYDGAYKGTYNSLDDAMQYAEGMDAEIRLYQDVEESVVLDLCSKITLDLNGHKMLGDESKDYVLKNHCPLTIIDRCGGGIIEAASSSEHPFFINNNITFGSYEDKSLNDFTIKSSGNIFEPTQNVNLECKIYGGKFVAGGNVLNAAHFPITVYDGLFSDKTLINNMAEGWGLRKAETGDMYEVYDLTRLSAPKSLRFEYDLSRGRNVYAKWEHEETDNSKYIDGYEVYITWTNGDSTYTTQVRKITEKQLDITELLYEKEEGQYTLFVKAVSTDTSVVWDSDTAQHTQGFARLAFEGSVKDGEDIVQDYGADVSRKITYNDSVIYEDDRLGDSYVENPVLIPVGSKVELECRVYVGYYMNGLTFSSGEPEDFSFDGKKAGFTFDKGNEVKLAFTKDDTVVPVKLDLGEGHEELAKKVFDWENELVEKSSTLCKHVDLNDSVITFYWPKASTEKDFLLELRDAVNTGMENSLGDNKIDNNEKFYTCYEKGAYASPAFGLKPISQYTDEKEVAEDVKLLKDSEELRDDLTLYMLWMKPVETISYTMDIPDCKTEVVLDPDTFEQTNAPELTPVSVEHMGYYDALNETVSDSMIARWVTDSSSWSIKYSSDYLNGKLNDLEGHVGFALKAEFGYYLNVKNTKVLINASPAEVEDDSDIYYCNYTFAIKHSWNEGVVTTEPTEVESGVRTFTCEVCEMAKTEEIPPTGGSENPDPDPVPDPTPTPEPDGPGDNPSGEQKQESETCPVGTQLRDKKNSAKYIVTSLSGTPTAAYIAPVSKKIKTVVIPAYVTVDGVKYKVTEIKANAFKGCKKLTKVTIGVNVNKIGAKAFYGCSKLKNVIIKTSKLKLKRVGKNAFGKIHKKAVAKAPKKVKKTYKNILKKRGMKGKTQKIK